MIVLRNEMKRLLLSHIRFFKHKFKETFDSPFKPLSGGV